MENVVVKSFDELSLKELYQILMLRSEVFVVEQDCVYQDLDNKDAKALHLFIKEEDYIVAYTRLFEPGVYFEEASIGRVVVKKYFRKKGLGHQLMEKSVATINSNFETSHITLSAQKYLQKFYEHHGFKVIGQEYLEDGIPHVRMVKH